MRIQELLEAVPVGSSTQPLVTPGQPPAPVPPGQPPAVPGQTPPPAVPGQPPAVPGAAPAPTLGNQAAGQPSTQQPAMQQGMKDTMTDLDKIAAQIVGLKQKQQQMQQQMQLPTV